MNFYFQNVKINYEYKKNNDTLVLFLHGWGESINTFRPYYNRLQNETNLSLLNLDFPPFGESGEIKDWNVFTYENMIEELLKNFKFRNLIVICHSFGGRVAIELSKKINIFKIVFIDSAGIKDNSILLKIKKIFFKITKILVNLHIFSKKHLNSYYSDDYKSLNNNMKIVFNNIISYDQKKFLKNINSKTLIIWGKFDNITKIQNGKYFKKKIKNSKLIVLDSDHFCLLKKFDICYNYIYDFIIKE
jgi:pimeloyl-ACP methyl ester carboxylesterase